MGAEEHKRVVAEGDHVVIEHTETWHFETGEKLTNRFVTIHVVENVQDRDALAACARTSTPTSPHP